MSTMMSRNWKVAHQTRGCTKGQGLATLQSNSKYEDVRKVTVTVPMASHESNGAEAENQKRWDWKRMAWEMGG